MPGKINFNEPIPEMIERLKREHRNFESKLDEAGNHIYRNNDIVGGIRIIRNMSGSVLHHAVEEEARLMRVIMQNAKDNSSDSIRIMQEHNYVLDFFRNKLRSIEENTKSLSSKSQQESEEAEFNQKNELNQFITNLKSHFTEEEQIVFPLALKANLP